MPSIKESIHEVYEQHTFSNKGKQQVLENLTTNQKTFSWKPAIASVAIVMIMLVLSLSFTKEQIVETVSTNAPYNADDALIERFTQFQQILKDGQITEEERRQYISQSDWDLQLAFETGESSFYNRPRVTKQEANEVVYLLHNMYRIVYEGKLNEKKLSVNELQHFEEIVAFAPSFNEEVKSMVEKQYVSSLSEKPFTKNGFLNLDWWWQIVIVGLFSVVVYLFVQNIRIDRNKFTGLLQLVLIIVIGSFFFTVDKNNYCYDEASILETARQHVAMTEPSNEVTQLLSIAQFDEGRLALLKLADNKLLLLEFANNNGEFKNRGSITGNSLMTHMFPVNQYNESQQIFVVQDQDVAKIEMVDTALNETYTILTNEKTKIYLHTRPEKSREGSVFWYDSKGNLVDRVD